MNAARRGLAILTMVWLAHPAAAQSLSPRDEFLKALGQFSLAIDGRLGDEGPAIRASLDAMDGALEAWDARIRSYESAMAAEIGSADPKLAARMRLALGGVYLEQQRIDAALREFAAAEALDPDRADVHALLGAVHSQVTRNAPAALQALRRAATLDADNPIRAYVLLRHLAAAGTDPESAPAFRDFRLSPALRRALDSRAPIPAPFIRIGLLAETADIEPFFPPVRYAAGFAQLASGDYRGAMVTFRDAAAHDPLIADVGPHRDSLRRAAESVRAGLASQAIEQLLEAVSGAPDRAEPWRILGQVYVLDGQHDHAAAALQRAVSLSAQDERARLALAAALVEAARFDEAHQTLEQTLRTLPTSGRARYATARLYQREGRLTAAIGEFESAATLMPLLALNSLYETLGGLLARAQQFDGALAAYLRRADLHPNDPDAHADLGDIYLRQGRLDEALAELSIALLLNPSHAAAATLMARAHLMNAEYAAAEAAARRALEIDATQLEPRYVLGTALLRLKQVAEGNRELETYRRLETEAAAVRARLLEIEGLRRDAAVRAAAGDHSGAVASLRKVRDLDPSYTSLLELGLALLDASQAGEALEHLTAAANHRDAKYEVHRYLAAAYAALGQAASSAREQATYDRIRREDLKRLAAAPSACAP